MFLASEVEYICGAHQWQQPAERVQERPNHLLSGGTAALRSCQRGEVGGTSGTKGGLLCGWDCGAVLCRKGGDRARLGGWSPGFEGLCAGLCFVAGSS